MHIPSIFNHLGNMCFSVNVDFFYSDDVCGVLTWTF